MMTTFYDRSRQPFVLLVIFTILAYVGSFMYPEAHWHHGFLGGTVYIAIVIPLLAWLFYSPHNVWVARVFSSVPVWLVIILLFAVVDQRHFLQNQLLPDPGSSAKGMELPARALLLHGRELYSVSAIGTPVSPGPGWILMWSPITIPGWTGLLESIALTITAWMIYRRNRVAGGVFVCLLLLLPLFFRMSSGGFDLYAIPMAFVVLGLAVDDASESAWRTGMLAFVAGAVATARVPMLLPLVVLGFGLYRKDGRAGRIFLTVLIVTALAWHLSFAAIAHHAGDWYQPMHVLSRAGDSGTWNRVAAVVLSVACFAWCYKRMNGDVRTWLLGTFLMMMVLFTPTGISEGMRDRTWAWEGAGYICFPVPLLAAVIALNIRKQSLFNDDGAELATAS